MRLYLCGGGSGKQISKALFKFSKDLDKSKPILYVPLAMDETKYDSCYKWFRKEIKNINVNKFDMVRSSAELSKKDFHSYCAIFIGGGNTFKLLNEIKQNNNYEKILNYLNNDGIVFGGSAGAIIFGNDINVCLLDDKNKIGIVDTKSFGLLNNYSILCHLNKKNFKKNKDFLKEYSMKNKLIYIPEENVIIVSNNKVMMIGNKKYIILKNGNYAWHNFANVRKDLNQ